MASRVPTTPRRRDATGSSAETPRQRRDSSPERQISLIGDFPLVDLDQHPDGELLRLCGRMTYLQERFDQPGAGADQALSNEYWATADRITPIHPKTLDGFQMKAMVALGMLMPGQRQVKAMTGGRLSIWAGAVAIVNDVIRGLPA